MRETFKIAKTAAVTTALSAVNRESAANYLNQALLEMTGIGTKIGQILGMKSGSNIEQKQAIPFKEIQFLIKQESPEQFEQIATIDPRGKTASIGQAHRAILRDGRMICIKVQRPGIADAIREQLDIAFKLLEFSPAKKFNLDTESYRFFLKKSFEDELDYTVEARAQSRIRQDLSSIRNLIVPEIIFVTPKLLIQSYESGADLNAASQWPSLEQREEAAEALLTGFFRMLIVGGLLHADLHPNNLAFRALSPADVVLYDFGCTVDINQKHRTIFRDILSGKTLHNLRSTLHALVELGFDEEKLSQIPKAGAILNSFIEKLLSPDTKTSSELKIGSLLRSELGRESWWFRTAGPSWFLYVMRSIYGVLHTLDQLNIRINIASSVARAIEEDFSAPIRSANIDNKSDTKVYISKNLRVRVTENNHEVVSIELPARAVEDLEAILPDKAVLTLESSGINIQRIKEQALIQNCPPQILFQSSVGSREYCVWLE